MLNYQRVVFFKGKDVEIMDRSTKSGNVGKSPRPHYVLPALKSASTSNVDFLIPSISWRKTSTYPMEDAGIVI
jgi:hypothetical protein